MVQTLEEGGGESDNWYTYSPVGHSLPQSVPTSMLHNVAGVDLYWYPGDQTEYSMQA